MQLVTSIKRIDKERIYVGSFFNGMMHGNGKLLYNTGDEFVGEWKNGTPDCRTKGVYRLKFKDDNTSIVLSVFGF